MSEGVAVGLSLIPQRQEDEQMQVHNMYRCLSRQPRVYCTTDKAACLTPGQDTRVLSLCGGMESFTSVPRQAFVTEGLTSRSLHEGGVQSSLTGCAWSRWVLVRKPRPLRPA